MFISHGDAQLYAVEFGNAGRTLVAHGGWTGSWELWAEPFGILSKTWRTIAYDHRGTGATVASPESISFESLVGDLYAVLDVLGVERCVLAAESAGVAVALRAALEQPARFEGLVLIDGLYYRPVPKDVDLFVRGLETSFERTLEQFVEACVPQTEPRRAAVCAWGKKILMRSTPSAAIALHKSMYGVDLRVRVSAITQPTLVVHGAEDCIAPVSDSEWLASQLRNSRLEIVSGAGHVPTVTHAVEVAGAINAFFPQGGV